MRVDHGFGIQSKHKEIYSQTSDGWLIILSKLDSASTV